MVRSGAYARWLGGAALLWSCSAHGPVDETWPDLSEDIPPPASQPGALLFDGQAHYATLGTAGFPVGVAPQSIALWVRPTHLDGVQNFVVLRKDYQSGVQLGVQDGVLMAWRVLGGRVFVSASSSLEVGVWQHVAYVYDGAVHRLYVGGVEQGVGDLSPNNRTSVTGFLGSLDGHTEFFAGALDRVRIWNEARSALDIAADAEGGAPHASGLVVDLPCDEPDGLRAYDHSGWGNHAALGDGFPRWAPERVPGLSL